MKLEEWIKISSLDINIYSVRERYPYKLLCNIYHTEFENLHRLQITYILIRC